MLRKNIELLISQKTEKKKECLSSSFDKRLMDKDDKSEIKLRFYFSLCSFHLEMDFPLFHELNISRSFHHVSVFAWMRACVDGLSRWMGWVGDYMNSWYVPNVPIRVV